MLAVLRKILDLLSPKERVRGYLVLAMVLVMALLDMVGVASIMPFMAVLANPNVVEQNRYLFALYQFLGFPDPGAFLVLLGAAVFVSLVGSSAFKALTTYALLRFTHMRSYSLSRRLVEGYLRQPYEWFLNRHSADLGKTVLSEVGEVVTDALIPTMQLIAQGTVVVALLTLLIVVDPLLATVFGAGLGSVYAAIYLVLRRYLGRIGADRVNANRERFQIVQEAFSAIKEVKVGGLEAVFLQRFDGPAKRFARRQAAAKVANQLPRFALEAVAFGGMLLVVLYLMSAAANLQQVLPVLALYALAGYRLMPALQQVYLQAASLRFAGAALTSLHTDLIGLTSSDVNSTLVPERPAPMGLSRGLRLDRVSYSYPTAARPALKELTLEVPARSTVAFVGATGSGKTTAVDVILGLLSPHEGSLSADDVPITPATVRAWQRTVGYVPQDIHLVDDTIAANIAFGVPPQQIDHGAVERAGRIANLHDFITQQLPRGYATAIGERGVRLSGGQRQRIGIARALYHDPEVLVLDEATSALDNLTEQEVMDAVHNLGHRKTIIIVAHRLSTVRACDRIFLLEEGRLADSGTFESLIERDSRFRAMATGGWN